MCVVYQQKMQRAENYKRLPVRFEGPSARLTRAQKLTDRRKEKRAQDVDGRRALPVNVTEVRPVETVESRMARMLQWKKERDLIKKLSAASKKPVFKIGVPHHKLYSPASAVSADPQQPHCHRRPREDKAHKSLPVGRITRATEKRLASIVKSPIKLLKKARKALKPNVSISKKSLPSFAPEDYSFKAPSGLESVPMFGSLDIRPVKLTFDGNNLKMEDNPSELTFSIENLSTDDVHGDLKVDENVEDPNDVTPEAPTNKLSTSVRAYSPVPVQFSPFIVSSRGKSSARKEQKARMGLNSSLGDEIPTKDTVMQSLNISVEDEERTAQYYKYLVQSEINRLTELCEKWQSAYEDPETPETGRCLINMAIGQTNLLLKNKTRRFQQLVNDCESGKGEMLVRCRDLQGFWDTLSMEIRNCNRRFEEVEEASVKHWIEDVEEPTADVPMPKKKKPAVKKPKVTGKSNFRAFVAARKKQIAEKEKENEENVDIAEKSSKSAKKGTPQSRRASGLFNQSGQISRARRSINTCQTPEVTLDNSISYINSTQTPGKGILKRVEELRQHCLLKSANKVNFKDDEVPRERLKMSRISAGIEQKLDFFDKSFDEAQAPKVTEFPKPTTPKRSTINEMPDEHNEVVTTRVLRNRSILTHSTPTSSTGHKSRRSRKQIEENTESMQIDTPKENIVENPRRSTRRSVKFNEDECSGCSVSTAIPGTPIRSRKRRTIHEPQGSGFTNGDLISFESPAIASRGKHPYN